MRSKKIILSNGQAPGDGVAFCYAIKSLHETYPHKFITDVRSPYDCLFNGNPFITHIDDKDSSAEVINVGYDTIHMSNQYPYRFITGFMHDISNKLGINIKPSRFQGFVYIEEKEKYWYSVIYEKLKKDVPYWIINAGYKNDFTAKAWDFDRYQKIIDSCPDITFVQIGHKTHIHPRLFGDNLINLVGQTDLRQLVRLVYNSFGVITPISLPMMLAYGIDAHPRFKRGSRACIVIAGGREPNHWQQGPNQHFLHTCGMLDCCDFGGCWKSRIIALGDGDEKDKSLCSKPVKLKNNQTISKCMDMISENDVISIIRKYMDNLKYVC